MKKSKKSTVLDNMSDITHVHVKCLDKIGIEMELANFLKAKLPNDRIVECEWCDDYKFWSSIDIPISKRESALLNGPDFTSRGFSWICYSGCNTSLLFAYQQKNGPISVFETDDYLIDKPCQICSQNSVSSQNSSSDK